MDEKRRGSHVLALGEVVVEFSSARTELRKTRKPGGEDGMVQGGRRNR